MIKVINPNVEQWFQEGFTLDAIWEHIARCTRVAYQSTPRNKNENAYDFLLRTIFRGVKPEDIKRENISKYHLSCCEHGTVHLKYPACVMPRAAIQFNARLRRNKFSRWNEHNGYIYVTTNMRVLIENNWTEELEWIDATPNCPYYSGRSTFSFITNIGVSRELNRHRCHSIVEESTRFCNYSADKFGNNITVTKEPWIDYTTDALNDGDCYEGKLKIDEELYNEGTNLILYQNTDNWTAIDWYLYSIQIANLTYHKLRDYGWKAQQAREVLPLATKTQVVHTAYNDDWKHWIKLRYNEVSGPVHPCMKEIADKLVKLMSL